MNSFLLPVPAAFSFKFCYAFLQRSSKEVLHRCADEIVTKLLRIENEFILFSVKAEAESHLRITVLNTKPSAIQKRFLKNYVTEWFDLEADLTPFYDMAKKDSLLKDLVKKYYGYRIVGQPDLFESLAWAVLGQQINLNFAYTLKQRFVENFGERLDHNNQPHYVFPSVETVAGLTDEHLLPLQFSRQKSKYVVLIAEAFASGEISKEKLKGLPLLDAKEKLMKIKGVGNWTANYALMKTFRYPDAFPLEDAGIHNAIKNLKGMKTKPTLDQVKQVFKKYKGWEAYATLYLWKSL
ncbi:MAG: DNA-3-methyladenine glycosylase 2 family protein [Cyclobacteriaceae bacterium]|nr:DNA-3-methyladenine glycosylase 2 family protein [Cyclobacteriaceae bacterium]